MIGSGALLLLADDLDRDSECGVGVADDEGGLDEAAQVAFAAEDAPVRGG